jgi:hypothetical protein
MVSVAPLLTSMPRTASVSLTLNGDQTVAVAVAVRKTRSAFPVPTVVFSGCVP